jgi:hypothetical protein
MLPAKCIMSPWRKSEVKRVHTLPLRRLTPLNARYSIDISGSKSQKIREIMMQVIITKLIFLNYGFHPEKSLVFWVNENF